MEERRERELNEQKEEMIWRDKRWEELLKSVSSDGHRRTEDTIDSHLDTSSRRMYPCSGQWKQSKTPQTTSSPLKYTWVSTEWINRNGPNFWHQF